MINQHIVLSFCAFLAILAPLNSTAAYEAQAIDKKENICKSHTTLAEKKFGIPRRLLTAISLAESGRWNKLRKENIAWPWTVTSRGQGHFFKTKAEALAEIQILKSQGIKNIDVGCMQVNLYYHGNAFEKISDAIDPKANIAYAASYLKKLYSSSGNWTLALGNYHSTTPKLNKAYRTRVLAYLQGNNLQLETNHTKVINYPPAPIDFQRMAKLNASFRARAENQSNNENLKANTSRQLKAWRISRKRGKGMGLYLAMRRAAQRLDQKRRMDRLSQTGNLKPFAEIRAQQLSNWRLGDSNHWEVRKIQKSPRAEKNSLAADADRAIVY